MNVNTMNADKDDGWVTLTSRSSAKRKAPPPEQHETENKDELVLVPNSNKRRKGMSYKAVLEKGTNNSFSGSSVLVERQQNMAKQNVTHSTSKSGGNSFSTKTPPTNNNNTKHRSTSSNQKNLNFQPQQSVPTPNAKLQRIILAEHLTSELGKSMMERARKKNSIFQEQLSNLEIEKGELVVEGRGTTFLLVLKTRTPVSHGQQTTLQRFFLKKKWSAKGYLDWLGGDKGWRYEPDENGSLLWKQHFVIVFNCLQGVFKLYAPEKQLYMPGTKEMTWKKRTNLKDCVADIRMWMEILPRTTVTNELFRSSDSGPESPLHWAHHFPDSERYPLTVVTKKTMTELANGILVIFRSEFKCKTSGTPLGTHWSRNKHVRKTDWVEAKTIEWTKSRLELLLNGTGKFSLLAE